MTAAEALAPRRAGGDAGHVPGCARDHALDTACAVPSGEPGEPDIEFVRLPAPAPRVRPCVAALVTDGAGRLLLVRTRRGWELPGGGMEPGETWRDGLLRELLEETGLDVSLDPEEPRVFDGMPVNGAQYQSIILIARGTANGTPSPRAGDGALESAWFARDNLFADLSDIATRAVVLEWARADPHERSLRRVQDARAALRENLRAGYALDEGQIASVLRVADALAAGVSLEAREVLGREAHDAFFDHMHFGPGEGSSAKEDAAWQAAGVGTFALGRASVVLPDKDLVRILAAWRWLCAWDRDTLRLNAERYARAGIREVVERLFAKGDERGAVWVSLEFAPPPGVSVVGCGVDGQPATPEQWAKLRAAGVPVADGVGV